MFFAIRMFRWKSLRLQNLSQKELTDQIGVGFVSKLVAAQCIEGGRVVQVHVEGLNLKHDLVFMRNKRLPMTRSQSVVWEFMQQNTAIPNIHI